LVSILIDDDILLRSFTSEDAGLLFEAVEKSRRHLRPWLSWVDATTRQEHSLQFIQQSLSWQHNQEGLALGIFYKNKKIIGSVGLHHWDQNLKKGQLGYWIASEFEGQGIIHKSLLRFIDFLFTKVALNKVEVCFMQQNTRSAKVAERLGCKIEGLLRQSYLKDGKLEDLVVTGLLRSEWNPLTP
jgi:ribosomal-protein-serine acetyltransferase